MLLLNEIDDELFDDEANDWSAAAVAAALLLPFVMTAFAFVLTDADADAEAEADADAAAAAAALAIELKSNIDGCSGRELNALLLVVGVVVDESAPVAVAVAVSSYWLFSLAALANRLWNASEYLLLSDLSDVSSDAVALAVAAEAVDDC